MMTIIAVLSLILYGYAIWCIFREIILINRKSHLQDKHKGAHLSILLTSLGTYSTLLYWVFSRKGVEYGLYTNLIEQNFWLFLVSITVLSTSVTRHFRKERNGEDLLLNMRKEFKRTMTFGFYKESSFQKIVSEFIKDKGVLGKDVFYISSTDDDVERLKFLKKGDTNAFSATTWLEKMTDAHEHNYTYHNTDPLIFGLHIHLFFKEVITPLDGDLKLFLLRKNKMEKITIKKGETYVVPKNIKHGVIFTKANRTTIKWI